MVATPFKQPRGPGVHQWLTLHHPSCSYRGILNTEFHVSLDIRLLQKIACARAKSIEDKRQGDVLDGSFANITPILNELHYFQKELAIIYLSHRLFGLLALVVGTFNICTPYPSFQSFAQTS